MDGCFNLLGKKCFHRMSLIGVLIFSVTEVGIFSYLSFNETREDDTFRCYDSEDQRISDRLRDRCYAEYNNQFNQNLPLWAFTLMNCASVQLVCVVYSQFVRLQVENETGNNNNSASSTRTTLCCKVFTAYFAHLLVRSILMTVALVLLWGVIYLTSFPESFSCQSQQTTNKSPTNNTLATMIPYYHCKNPKARSNTICGILFVVVTVLFLVLSLVEFMYLFYKTKSEPNFKENANFCRSYLNSLSRHVQTKRSTGRRRSSDDQQVESLLNPKEILLPDIQGQRSVNKSEGAPHVSTTLGDPVNERIQKFQKDLWKQIVQSTDYVKSPIPAGEASKKWKLDEIFVDLVIQTGRKQHFVRSINERDDVVKSYPLPDRGAFAKPTEIFIPSEETSDPRQVILAVGRPGIGKSCLVRKIVRELSKTKYATEQANAASGQTTSTAEHAERGQRNVQTEDTWKDAAERAKKAEKSLKRFNFVFFFEFRKQNNMPKISLKDMLERSPFSINLDGEVKKHILNNPEEVLLVFDGLDEAKNIDKDIKDADRFPNNDSRVMPTGALFEKLVHGKLLSGVTVLATTRSTAIPNDLMLNLFFENVNREHLRTVEVLGFTEDRVQNFINKFTSDRNMQERISNHIAEKANLLSLCYIPVNCFIVC